MAGRLDSPLPVAGVPGHVAAQRLRRHAAAVLINHGFVNHGLINHRLINHGLINHGLISGTLVSGNPEGSVKISRQPLNQGYRSYVLLSRIPVSAQYSGI